jgi:hypothetical protein
LGYGVPKRAGTAVIEVQDREGAGQGAIFQNRQAGDKTKSPPGRSAFVPGEE